MSDEMALSDNVPGDDAKMNGEEAASVSAVEAEPVQSEVPIKSEEPPTEDLPAVEPAKDETDSKLDADVKLESPATEPMEDVKPEPELKTDAIKEEPDTAGDGHDIDTNEADDKRGIKRRASVAFSDAGDVEFVGFEAADTAQGDLAGYNKLVERLEAEVSAARKEYVPVRNVMGTPATVRASKRPRQDTDGSRPSSALSSRSDGDGAISSDITPLAIFRLFGKHRAVSSPLSRGGRRATTEMSSPLLRAPLEAGWRRELVYRAALDAHSRRNADIYYYTPHGKKLRSTREVAEHLSGTGLTLENFSFFKEPLGVDDPEKEIIRDAKLMRRVESPVAAVAPPPTEGKRTPKPKPPKGASPEPPAIKSPPAKLKVKSMGSRLSNNASTPPATRPPKKSNPAAAPAATDNNNSAAWKKPRPPHVPAAPVPVPAAPAPAPAAPVPAAPVPAPAAPGPAGHTRPPVLTSPEQGAGRRQLVQPCSLTCGRGVPSLACAACLCLYHPACAAYYRDTPHPFYCKNCRKSSSPSRDPPTLTHKSGAGPLPAPVPRRVPAPVPVPVPVPKPRPEKRVMLRMKAASGGPTGERVWAVSGARPGGPASLPQSLASLNGRRFVVVPRALLPNHTVPADE